ncbi:hypothetical protein BC827DRAFT_1158381 [Russula dissimulans]|nr:hypothetical protein BC827DRAFT_1158381 [Russula dissimulans]
MTVTFDVGRGRSYCGHFVALHLCCGVGERAPATGSTAQPELNAVAVVGTGTGTGGFTSSRRVCGTAPTTSGRFLTRKASSPVQDPRGAARGSLGGWYHLAGTFASTRMPTDLEDYIPRVEVFHAHVQFILVVSPCGNITMSIPTERGGKRYGEASAKGTLRSTDPLPIPLPASSTAPQTHIRLARAHPWFNPLANVTEDVLCLAPKVQSRRARTLPPVSVSISALLVKQLRSEAHLPFTVVSPRKGNAPLGVETSKQECPTNNDTCIVPASLDSKSTIARAPGPMLTMMSTIFQNSSRSASSACVQEAASDHQLILFPPLSLTAGVQFFMWDHRVTYKRLALKHRLLIHLHPPFRARLPVHGAHGQHRLLSHLQELDCLDADLACVQHWRIRRKQDCKSLRARTSALDVVSPVIFDEVRELRALGKNLIMGLWIQWRSDSGFSGPGVTSMGIRKGKMVWETGTGGTLILLLGTRASEVKGVNFIDTFVRVCHFLCHISFTPKLQLQPPEGLEPLECRKALPGPGQRAANPAAHCEKGVRAKPLARQLNKVQDLKQPNTPDG